MEWMVDGLIRGFWSEVMDRHLMLPNLGDMSVRTNRHRAESKKMWLVQRAM